jgi:hypothetical protein
MRAGSRGPLVSVLHAVQYTQYMKMTAFWDKFHVVSLRYTYVPEVRTATTIRVMMEAVRTSEMLVSFNETTWCFIAEGCDIHTCRCENLKSHTPICYVCQD